MARPGLKHKGKKMYMCLGCPGCDSSFYEEKIVYTLQQQLIWRLIIVASKYNRMMRFKAAHKQLLDNSFPVVDTWQTKQPYIPVIDVRHRVFHDPQDDDCWCYEEKRRRLRKWKRSKRYRKP